MDIAADKVGEVILLAREIAQEMPGAEAEFDGLVEAMDEDERADLVALMWVGRGDFEPEEWDEARRTAIEEATTPTASYLKGSPHLADHLEAGLEAMGIDPREAEDDVTRPV
ncbi:DUF3775 domain-containing protein [Rubellimicrobium sp. CFH 75288]|uniref:DUF3775 domain-containing protein n=1 Tax=Rubellimicrobium sp. CFH 75288 TaxID=2697034 RepID=UPI0014134A98|nr:DUF3775 domain-containing protein [Rubellimicrobium sp. CFH 75288]NAZ37232.1 DUF3775 domain-containing protein [Rubellimicrobium sp. CFH 75288]